MKNLLIFLLLIFASCNHEEIPGGQITIKNDIMDKDFNSFVISNIKTASGGTSFSKTLKPGEKSILPQKGVETFVITRKYKDHSKIYEVSCPKNFKRVVTMKLIDIHTNNIDGGCVLSRKGIIQDGFTRWSKN